MICSLAYSVVCSFLLILLISYSLRIIFRRKVKFRVNMLDKFGSILTISIGSQAKSNNLDNRNYHVVVLLMNYTMT